MRECETSVLGEEYILASFRNSERLTVVGNLKKIKYFLKIIQ